MYNTILDVVKFIYFIITILVFINLRYKSFISINTLIIFIVMLTMLLNTIAEITIEYICNL